MGAFRSIVYTSIRTHGLQILPETSVARLCLKGV